MTFAPFSRALNSLLYWSSQMVGSLLIGRVLDLKSLRRRTRAFIGWGILFAMVFIIHGWAYSYQKYVGNAMRAASCYLERQQF